MRNWKPDVDRVKPPSSWILDVPRLVRYATESMSSRTHLANEAIE